MQKKGGPRRKKKYPCKPATSKLAGGKRVGLGLLFCEEKIQFVFLKRRV